MSDEQIVAPFARAHLTYLLVQMIEKHFPPAVEASAHLLGIVRRRLILPLPDELRERIHTYKEPSPACQSHSHTDRG